MEDTSSFEELYTRPGVVRCHREAPLATEREAYHRESAARGVACGTLFRQARYGRYVAMELQRHAPDRCFTRAEVRILAQAGAARRFPEQQTPSPRGAAENFRIVAEGFLRDLAKLRPVGIVAQRSGVQARRVCLRATAVPLASGGDVRGRSLASPALLRLPETVPGGLERRFSGRHRCL